MQRAEGRHRHLRLAARRSDHAGRYARFSSSCGARFPLCRPSQRLPVDDASQRRLDRDRLSSGAPRPLGTRWRSTEGEGLVCRSAGHPDFPRLRRATGRTLQVPTLAERLRPARRDFDLLRQCLARAAYFQDPEGMALSITRPAAMDRGAAGR